MARVIRFREARGVGFRRQGSLQGGRTQVERYLSKLMQELGAALDQSLAESESIAKVVSKIKADGYDIFLVFEVTAGFTQHDGPEEEEAEAVERGGSVREATLTITEQDLKFLKSLRIKAEK